MASDPIQISWDSSEVDRALLKKISALNDVTPFLEQASLHMARSIKKNFEKGGRPTKWKKSGRAMGQGKKKGRSGRTLVDTENLMGSITPEVVGREGVIGTSVLYGPIHNYGINKTVGVKAHNRSTGSGSVKVKAHSRQMKMPKREFLMFQKQDYRILNSMMSRHLDS